LQRKKRIEKLLDRRPHKARVFSFDEKGTLVVKSYAGRSWSKKAPHVPAKQNIHGKCELLAAYDVHSHKAYLRFYSRKSAREIIRCFEFLRKRYKAHRLYIVLDCWRAHRSKMLKAYVKTKPITLVELPTNCSWLNPVERVFADIQRQVLVNSEFRTLAMLKSAIRSYVKSEYPKHI
jgi:transposase